MKSRIIMLCFGILLFTVCKDAVGSDLQHDLLDACRKGNRTAVETLIEEGADVNARGQTGTPLLVTAYRGYVEIADLLIRRGANVNPDGENPLSSAAMNGHL